MSSLDQNFSALPLLAVEPLLLATFSRRAIVAVVIGIGDIVEREKMVRDEDTALDFRCSAFGVRDGSAFTDWFMDSEASLGWPYCFH